MDDKKTEEARQELTATCACPDHEGGLVKPANIIELEGHEHQGWCNACDLKAKGEA